MKLSKRWFCLTSSLILLALAFSNLSLADTYVFSDTEGSAAKLDSYVRQGKLKWIQTPAGRRIQFVNQNDKIVFLGDLSGPNWIVPNNPQNIFIRDVFLDLEAKSPNRFEFILGNHEANRFGFIRDNIRMERGEDAEYIKWLTSKNLKDCTENRVTFWGTNTYGLNKEGVALPIANYQMELSNSLGRPVSTKEAAEAFAADLKVGKDGKPDGKLLQLLLHGKESTYHSGYAMTHAANKTGAAGIIPLDAIKYDGGATWLKKRNDYFFRPQIKKFMRAARKGAVPSSMLADLGDARWDSVAKRVVSDSASLSYTERGMLGDQYTGVAPSIAERFAKDPQSPALGLISGHKPSGNITTTHTQMINGKRFFDVVADTSRGKYGEYSTLTIKDNGDLEITAMTEDGKFHRWIVNQDSDQLLGKLTDDGFHIKGTSNDDYILERYVGYNLEQKVVPKNSIDPAKTMYSFEDPATDKVRLQKIASLENAIREHGGQILTDVGQASRVVGDRFVLDIRGASKWAAVDEVKAEEIRKQLVALADHLDPSKVVIITGGNRAGHPNAVENMAHDVFAGPDAKKNFDIIGFMKSDTPADEVDKSVRYIVTVGKDQNWDAAVQEAQKFVSKHRGANVTWGGGGILERAADTPIAATMKERILMVQGFGGASEIKAAKGVAVTGINQILAELYKLDPSIFEANPINPPRLLRKPLVCDSTQILKTLLLR